MPSVGGSLGVMQRHLGVVQKLLIPLPGKTGLILLVLPAPQPLVINMLSFVTSPIYFRFVLVPGEFTMNSVSIHSGNHGFRASIEDNEHHISKSG